MMWVWCRKMKMEIKIIATLGPTYAFASARHWLIRRILQQMRTNWEGGGGFRIWHWAPAMEIKDGKLNEQQIYVFRYCVLFLSVNPLCGVGQQSIMIDRKHVAWLIDWPANKAGYSQ